MTGLGRPIAEYLRRRRRIEEKERLQRAAQYPANAKQIDAARHPEAVMINLCDGVGAETRVTAPTRESQAMEHVSTSLVRTERIQVMRGDHALLQLFHARARERIAQRRLAQQDALQQGTRALLKIGEHAELFEGALRQVVRLVHHQQRTLPRTPACGEKFLQPTEQLGIRPLRVEMKGRGDGAQEVVGLQLRRHEIADHHLAARQFAQQRAQHGRLAGASGAGEDDEALALIETVPQIGQRTLVRGAGEEEMGVRAQAKRLCPQSVELLVHRRPRQKAGTDIMCRYQHSFRSEDWNAALWKESSMDVLRPITEMPRIVSVLAKRGDFSIRAMASTCTYGRPCGLRRVSQTIVEVTMGRRVSSLRFAFSFFFWVVFFRCCLSTLCCG